MDFCFCEPFPLKDQAKEVISRISLFLCLGKGVPTVRAILRPQRHFKHQTLSGNCALKIILENTSNQFSCHVS